MGKSTKRQSYNKKKLHLSKIQITTLSIIGLAFVLVFAAVICSVIFSPEKRVQSKIEALASKYYETFIYETVSNRNDEQGTIAALEKFQETGLTAVSLRQIFARSAKEDLETTVYIDKYCDEDRTMVKIYPEPPYSAYSYRLDITYSCNF